MNKEFPIDRFFRKNTGKIMIALFILMVLAVIGPIMVPIAHHMLLMNVMLIFLAVFMVAAVGASGWQIYWRIKYPPTIEHCKECGRALPIKYED